MQTATRILFTILITLGFMASAQATLFVPSYGDTGDQTYLYEFDDDWKGTITIGVSDEKDTGVSSFLALWPVEPEPQVPQVFSLTSQASLSTLYDINLLLDTDGDNEQDTSMYSNTYGEKGTNGELFSFEWWAYEGDTLSFNWRFYTKDYDPFNDFAFISFGDHYEVLAQIDGKGTSLPGPAPLPLLLIGLFSLAAARRLRR